MSDDVREPQDDDLYDTAAAEYAADSSHARGDDVALMLEWLEPRSGWSLLDIPDGDGNVASALAPHVRELIAADLDPERVNRAQARVARGRRTNVTCEPADAQALPYADGAFDAVVCRLGAHHFHAPERFVAEVARVLKPGGRFLFIDDVAPDDAPQATLMNAMERLRDPAHVRALSVREWMHLFAESGLSVRQNNRDRTRRGFPEWSARTCQDEARLAALEQTILEMPRFARAYFAVCTAGPRVVSLEVDRWYALAVRA